MLSSSGTCKAGEIESREPAYLPIFPSGEALRKMRATRNIVIFLVTLFYIGELGFTSAYLLVVLTPLFHIYQTSRMELAIIQRTSATAASRIQIYTIVMAALIAKTGPTKIIAVSL